jgi:hypothetical protein
VLAWSLYALVLLLFATYPWLDRLVRVGPLAPWGAWLWLRPPAAPAGR